MFVVNRLIEYTLRASIIEVAAALESTMLLTVKVILDKALLTGIRLRDTSSFREILDIQYWYYR